MVIRWICQVDSTKINKTWLDEVNELAEEDTIFGLVEDVIGFWVKWQNVELLEFFVFGEELIDDSGI